jgi:multicomponent Na+:H+ antiporter subunit G
MQSLFLLIASLFILAGTGLSIVGFLGLKWLPDVYSRLQATGKVGVFGIILLSVGVFTVGLQDLNWGMMSRAAILFLFLLVVAPTAAHAISSAAYRFGVEPELGHSQRDDLARDIRKATEEMLAELDKDSREINLDDTEGQVEKLDDSQGRVEERPKTP